MCGIGGIVSPNPVNLSMIHEMMDIQSHRGPDGQGFLIYSKEGITINPERSNNIHGTVALGHRRLSILDTSESGSQPMSLANQRFWITYNGEIYNYLELKSELQQAGYQFKTGTDTEVILTSYAAWGVDCFKKFNGMWALAILDLEQRVLVLSRDRFGEKPLHYFQYNESLIFSSEIKGIIAAAPQEDFTANTALITDYLRFGVANHTDETFFKEIKSFPPTSYAVISLDHPHHWTPKKYWHLLENEEISAISFEEAKHHLQELFLSSLKLRLRSDVPVGFCLSGGLDSSSIVCGVAKLASHDHLETFTAVSDLPQYSEKDWAESVINHVKAQPNFIQTQVSSFLDELPQLLWHQEEPFTTTSIYAQWSVMAQARGKSIPVLLDGQGADEILCGYRKFYLFYLQNLLKRKNISLFLKESFALMVRGDRNILNYRDGFRYLPPFLRNKLEGKGHQFIANNLLNSLINLGSSTTIAQKQHDDLFHFSLPSLLRYEDRNSMAWSIESRVPFLDHRLVEFLVSLPVEYKLHKGLSKYIMRQSFTNFVPSNILSRRDKMGFVTPQDVWMKGQLGNHILSQLQASKSWLKNYINLPQLEESLQQGKSLNQIFRVFILDQWIEKFNVRV